MWWLVRHSAGMLALKPDEAAKVLMIHQVELAEYFLNNFFTNFGKAVLSFIVRQKQVSFGIKKNKKNNEISIKS